MEADPLIPVTAETMPAHATIAGTFDTTDQSPATPFDDLATVIALYEQRVYRFLLSSVRDPDLAQTLTQETFLRAWTSRASFRSDCSIATWLMRLALNLVRDHTRTERFRFWKRASATALDVSEVSAHIPNRESSPEARLIANQQLALVWESVGQLSERQRSIFLLRFVEELELSEIANITGLPISTVKSHLYRALHSIRARQNNPSQKESL
ncbi:RNA polymerase sigma-70 factor (ECF subfamily) [Edaphobacter aggregans]|uniref:RNA polymerase sigma-70 factor (ECF subfamily) n=2 Tax=Edaphobacter aggregans TaxID=570835 RepID=A0A428MH28_9BACT|nr:RNA polymerase sigma-70 factor (ECF subfamily) [Edaphobacter aggregans]